MEFAIKLQFLMPVKSLNSLNSFDNSSILFQNSPGKHWNHSANQQTDSY